MRNFWSSLLCVFFYSSHQSLSVSLFSMGEISIAQVSALGTFAAAIKSNHNHSMCWQCTVPSTAAVFHAPAFPGLRKTGLVTSSHIGVQGTQEDKTSPKLMLHHQQPDYTFNLPWLLCSHFFSLGKLPCMEWSLNSAGWIVTAEEVLIKNTSPLQYRPRRILKAGRKFLRVGVLHIAIPRT